MNSDPYDLPKQFREMSDDELIGRYRDGTLTESAQSVAGAELTSRGIPIPEPAPSASGDDDYAGDFVTIAHFANATDAHVICSCLQAGGVPAIIADANLVQTNALLTIAVGGVRILVPASYVAEAREVIDAFDRGDLALRDDDES